MATEPCAKELKDALHSHSLMGVVKKCPTRVRRDAWPHTCGVCHAVVGGVRCATKSAGKAGVMCADHADLDGNVTDHRASSNGSALPASR